jgi:hypothetical protein
MFSGVRGLRFAVFATLGFLAAAASVISTTEAAPPSGQVKCHVEGG